MFGKNLLYANGVTIMDKSLGSKYQTPTTFHQMDANCLVPNTGLKPRLVAAYQRYTWMDMERRQHLIDVSYFGTDVTTN